MPTSDFFVEDNGFPGMDRVQRLEVQVLALQALVQMLVDRDVASSELTPEEYVQSEVPALLIRCMKSPIWRFADDGVGESAEALASEVIEEACASRQRREAN